MKNPLAKARDQLIAAARAASAKTGTRFIRVEIPVSGISPLAWLAAQHHPIKGYWSARDGSLEVAAIGEADELKSAEFPTVGNVFHQIFQRLENCDPEIRYFGGFRFGDWHATDQTWRAFGVYRFLLPQVELVRRGDAVALACNFGAGDAGSAAATLAALSGIAVEPRQPRGPLPRPTVRMDTPDRKAWLSAVAEASRAISDKRLRKLVLARRACFDFGQPLDAFELLMRLRETTPDCYHFCAIHAGGRVAFMGAPPERLFARIGDEVLSEAVAGTRPRGASDAEDHKFANELLSDKKEREEHSIVVQGINEALAPICIGLKHEPAPHVAKLGHVQHLVTHFVGKLAPGISDEHLFARLHPTPAVAGYPREAALDEIARLESFDRGWYAAPVGWINRDASEFAVAIRCGAVFGSRLCLFSGAGIVEGSDPESEWNEVEIKIGHFISALTQP